MTETPRTPEDTKKAGRGGEGAAKPRSTLSSKSQEIFNKMSEGAKKIANEAYKGIGADRVVDELKIVWNHFGIDRHQREATRFNSQMDGFDSRIGELNRVKKGLELNIEELKQNTNLGVDPSSLQSEIKWIDDEIGRLQNDKKGTQSKFEYREKKIQTCIEKRDRVANRFIERYEEKLRPMEEELKKLETSRGQVNFSIKRIEIKHKEELAELDKLEKQRNGIADNLLRARMSSEKKIRKDKTIKQLDKQLRDRREAMRVEKENLAERKAEIDRDIARVNAEANAYRDKREAFVRIKERRPIEFNVPAGEAVPVENPNLGRTGEKDEESAKVNEQLTATHIDNWNEFLKEKYKGDAEELDKEDFLKEADLSKMDIRDFKDLLGEYLKYKGKPMDQFNKSINEFIKSQEKVKAHSENKDGTKNSDSDETKEGTKESAEVNKQSVATYINNWNKFLKEKYKGTEELNKEDFLKKTGLSEDKVVDLKNFKDDLAYYLKYYKKNPMAQFYVIIDKFQGK